MVSKRHTSKARKLYHEHWRGKAQGDGQQVLMKEGRDQNGGENGRQRGGEGSPHVEVEVGVDPVVDQSVPLAVV